MTMYERLYKKKNGQTAMRMTERQKWNQINFSFLKSHIAIRAMTKQLGKVCICKLSIHSISMHFVPVRLDTTYFKLQLMSALYTQVPCLVHEEDDDGALSVCRPSRDRRKSPRTTAPGSASGSLRRRSACMTRCSGGSRRMCSRPAGGTVTW